MSINKINIPELKWFILLFLLTTLFLLLGYSVSRAYINKVSFENDIINKALSNEDSVFSISSITYFSSASCDSEINSNTSLKLKNLYQYTDIALFISPINENELTYKNTLKNVYIDNIHITNGPKEGTADIYFKSIKDFTKPIFISENKITDSLTFNITSESEADLSTPVLYNNCANPIIISYINKNIKENFTLPDASEQIVYDGSLLKRCGITLSSIKSNLSFDIHITNNENENFICPIYLDIPLELSNGSSIYDGKILKKDLAKYLFYKFN